MIDKEVHLRAIVFDIPGKNFGLCCFEHDLLQPQCTNDLRHRLGWSCFHILADPFRLDHNHVCSSLQEARGLPDGPLHVAGAFGLELPSGAGSASTKLDSDFWLGLETGPLYLLYQAQPVINRDCNKAAGDLQDIKPHVTAFLNIVIDYLGSLSKDMLDEPARGNQDIVAVGQPRCLFSGPRGPRWKRTPRELPRIYVSSHSLQNIFQVAFPHWGIVRATNLGNASTTRLLLALVHMDESESAIAHYTLLFTLAKSSVNCRTSLFSNCSTVSSMERRSLSSL